MQQSYQNHEQKTRSTNNRQNNRPWWTEHSYPFTFPDQPAYQSNQLPCIAAGDPAGVGHLASCGNCLPIEPELATGKQQRVIAVVQQTGDGHRELDAGRADALAAQRDPARLSVLEAGRRNHP